MFGHDDTQQPAQDNPMPASDSMPDPINSPVFGQNPSSPGPDLVFGAPTPGAPPAPAQDLTTPELPSRGTPDPMPSSDSFGSPSPAPSSPGGSDDLLDLKQQALQNLGPLVSHLDQTPEEKFRTTMMMIQASDDQNLIKTAFDAAQQISDDKARAQALLDIINEINYFTQHQS